MVEPRACNLDSSVSIPFLYGTRLAQSQNLPRSIDQSRHSWLEGVLRVEGEQTSLRGPREGRIRVGSQFLQLPERNA